jgi:hypothetical protein
LRFAFCVLHCTVGATAQTVLDRVVARVENHVITLTDVRAAAGLGIIAGPTDEMMQPALDQLIDRQLVLIEVQRFPPPEPPAPAVEAEVATIRTRVGPRLQQVMASSGVDDLRLREIARENLRIRGYLDQRFGTTVQVSDDEVDKYYRAHPDEFLRDGLLIPFAEAEPLARERAAAERRQATVAQWITGLRSRADVTFPPPQG